ncbi:MAG: recombinase family protein [Proteobacteria bacterium]|nr:recombinase family protein [Pseudomonadota bacterium]
MSGRLRRAGGGRDQRPALDVMLKAATRGEFDDVAAWSVDRLGRSLQHLLDLTGHLLDLSASPLKADSPVQSQHPTWKLSPGNALIARCRERSHPAFCSAFCWP